jgi:hypothetical protein
MATILDKDITRESTVLFDKREIQVTLTTDQKIVMKLKGMKSGTVSISIEELYNQLANIELKPSPLMSADIKKGPLSFSVDSKDTDKVNNKKDKTWNDSPMINLMDLRSLSAITVMPIETKVLFEKIILNLIRNVK